MVFIIINLSFYFYYLPVSAMRFAKRFLSEYLLNVTQSGLAMNIDVYAPQKKPINKAAALFTFVVPFLISTCGGTIIAIIITLPLKKSGMLGRMKESLEE